MCRFFFAANARGRIEPLLRRWLVAAVTLQVIAGCAHQDQSLLVETAYPKAPDQLAQGRGPGVSTLDSNGIPNPSAITSIVAAEAVPIASVGAGPSEGASAGVASGTRVPAPPAIPPPSGEYPIDLATALRLADVSNPTIAKARTMILEALALQLTARSLLLPSLNSGASYHGHNGSLQRSSGKMIDVSLQSLYVGAGANTSVAGTLAIPGVNVFSQLSDAWFEPLVARQRVLGARFSAQATANDILLDVAVLVIELLGNQSLLDAQRRSESEAYQIVRTTQAYSDTGQGRKADTDRARAEWRYRRADVQKAEEALGVVSARLANRLNLDPGLRLKAVGGPLVPLFLIDLDAPRQDLIKLALERRPDLAARNADVGQAEAYVKEEVSRPLLPTLWLGFSGGGFGGGSNLVPPLVGNFGSRSDFDVRVYWTLLNFGAGNLSLIRRRQAEVGQAMAERQRAINRVRSEVMSALADAQAAHNQIEMARRELASAEPGFLADLARTRANQGKPIEVINSLTLLADARVNLVRALVGFDQAQFRLWVALGSPPPLAEPASPARPIPLTTNYRNFDPGAAKGIQNTGKERINGWPKGSRIKRSLLLTPALFVELT
jgi:outer membrane protein TolC